MTSRDQQQDDAGQVNNSRNNPQGRNRNRKKRKHQAHSHDTDSRQDIVPLPLLQPPELPEFNLTTSRQPKSLGTPDSEMPAAKKMKKLPKKDTSNYPSISFSSDARLQSTVKISDLQGLVLYLLADGTSPQWISVRHRPEVRKVVVIMIPGLEMRDFKIPKHSSEKSIEEGAPGVEAKEERPFYGPEEYYYPKPLSAQKIPAPLSPFAEMFQHVWPVKTPGDDRYSKMHSPLFAMLNAPLSKNQEDVAKKDSRTSNTSRNIRTPVTEYLASTEDLAENDYVLHPAAIMDDHERSELLDKRRVAETTSEHGWVDTQVANNEDGSALESDIQQGSLTAGRTVLAMDCEMCMTGPTESSLTRISIVSWDGTVILDELVKPDKPIVDYVTRFSGITEAMLAPVTTTLKDVQQKLLKILHPKSILIGHSLNSDLTALKMTHPFIIDTSLLYPHPRGPPLKSSLKYLANKYLGKEIQKAGESGHDSIEDARTCLDLVKQKCERGPHHGSNEAAHENIFKRLARAGVNYKNNGGATSGGILGQKSTAAVDWGNPKLGPGATANFVIGCKSDEDVTAGVIRAVKGDADGKEIPGGGVDFVWARMRELEALRGWWNDNKTIATPLPTETTALMDSMNGLALPNNTTTQEVLDSNAVAKHTGIGMNSEQASVQQSEVESIAVQEAIASLPKITTTPSNPAVLGRSNPYSGSEAAQNDATEQSTPPLHHDPLPPAPQALPALTSSSNESKSPPLAVKTSSGDDALEQALTTLSANLFKIYTSLPPCTAIILYSGSGDPREMSRLQGLQQTFKREYRTKKWDELSVKWTDVEEQALRKAARDARAGLGFVGIK